jgi:transcriptional regulator with GAF, ATPase, and Fis domain
MGMSTAQRVAPPVDQHAVPRAVLQNDAVQSSNVPESLDDLGSPRRAARQALELLQRLNGAHCAALFRPVVDRLRLFASVAIDQEALDQAQLVRLTSSRPDGGTHLLIPLLHEGALAALIYLDSSRSRGGDPLDEPSLEHLGPSLTQAVLLPGPDLAFLPRDLSAYLARISTHDMRRIHLLAQLEGNEWNIARTARRMGVARATIYEWMKKFDIPARPAKATRRRRSLERGR